MKRLQITLILLSCITIGLHAQSVDAILAQIAQNNKTIKANIQYWEEQKVRYRTGISLYNPVLEYDFLAGTPAIGGNQHDFTVSQSFDFPTAYVKKSQLAKQQSAQAEHQLVATRQNVLIEAKNICLELVYRNKLALQLTNRRVAIEKLQKDFKVKLDKGDGNILDLNKATLQLIEIKKDLQENLSEISQLNQKLTSLNGGIEISLTDTLYPAYTQIPVFEQLESDYETQDPMRKILEQQKAVSQKQLEVAKSLWLPKMELGYHYQGILGQTYNGVHTGIVLPLWENKNAVKAQQAKLLFDDLELQDHKNEHFYEIKALYTKYINLINTLNEYEQIYKVNNAALIDKALSLGQITTIEYFMEANFYYTSYSNYLQMEKELHETLALLYKYQL